MRPKQPSFSPFASSGSQYFFLLFGAEGEDGIHDQRRLHADEAAHAAVAALEFLHDEAVFDVGHAGAAVAVQVRAKEAEFAHRLDKLSGEAAVAVALLDDGNEVVFDELARSVARRGSSSSLRRASKPMKSTPLNLKAIVSDCSVLRLKLFRLAEREDAGQRRFP